MSDSTPTLPFLQNKNLADSSAKDKPWDKHKSLSMLVKRAYLSSFEKKQQRRGERMNECASWLLFELLQNDRHELRHKLFKAKFCRVRLCPVCMWRKSMAWRARIYQGFPLLNVLHPKPLAFLHLVLTVPNCEITELKNTIKHMNASWNRLTSRKGFPGFGFLRSLEVTKNSKDNTAHPHIHALIAVSPSYFQGCNYLNREELRQRWARALKVPENSLIHPFVARVKPGKGGLEGAVLEVTKYAVKMQGFHRMLRSPKEREWFLELDRQLDKTRSVCVGGLIRSVLSDDDISDAEMLVKGEESLDEVVAILRYDWFSKERVYSRTELKEC